MATIIFGTSNIQFAQFSQTQVYSANTSAGLVLVGQQFNAFGYDRIDILAQSKDNRTLLVIELKKGKGTDETVGQLLRYMGYMNTIKEENQVVRGMIIAHEANEQIQHALSMVPNVEFYDYKLNFSLTKLR